MKVWLAEYSPGYEPGHLLGVFATEALAEEAKRRECAKGDYAPDPGDVAVWEEDVLTELPPPELGTQPYQVIP